VYPFYRYLVVELQCDTRFISKLHLRFRPFPGQQPDFEVINAKNVAEAEGLDVNAGLHGNWTIENAKGRLHQFFQMNKINADYTYSAIGPAHSRFTYYNILKCGCHLFNQFRTLKLHILAIGVNLSLIYTFYL